MNLTELSELTRSTLWAGSRNERTAVLNGLDVVRRMGRETLVAELCQANVDMLRIGLRRDGLMPATINRKLSALSAMLRIAREHGHNVPHLNLRREQEPESARRVMTEAEVECMVRAIDPPFAGLTSFLAATGCRVSEALALRWANVDLPHRQVTFERTKSGRCRTVPLSNEAVGTLGVRGNDGPFSHLLYQDFYESWVATRNAVGLDRDLVPHCLRHTLITRLIRANVPIPVVQRWAGHSKLETTMRYVHMDGTDLEVALEALEATR